MDLPPPLEALPAEALLVPDRVRSMIDWASAGLEPYRR